MIRGEVIIYRGFYMEAFYFYTVLVMGGQFDTHYT